MKNSLVELYEQISDHEAEILKCIKKGHILNQRMLCERSGRSIGMVNKVIHSLQEKGLINGYDLTSPAESLFKKTKPENAIILAAGYGMRMVPINTSMPKALIEVKGEKLIERQIRQLHEVGVNDITVVVGFMKESFEYLIDQFGVKLAVNSDYATTNNIVSLNKVSDMIHNTYIVPCDVWCKNNPFSEDELYSWYLVTDGKDESSDVRINRKGELVRTKENESGNRMIGIAYLTLDEAKAVKEKLQVFIHRQNHDQDYWEETLYESGKMIVHGKVISDTDVYEINTYEQLREIDSDSSQLRSDAIRIITKELDCDLTDIKDIKVLKKGMTNRSFLFSVAKKKYIMRIPGEGTDQLINRAEEALVYQTIKGLSLCDDPVYIDPGNGYKITRYIDDVHVCDPENWDDVKKAMNKLKTFHELRIDGKHLSVPHTFDIFQKINFYESLWNGEPSIYQDYELTKRNVWKLKGFIDKYKESYQLTHIDAVPDNFLFDPNREDELSIQLTDWEYAGMQDKHVDIAMFAIYSLYDKEQTDRLIDIYFRQEGGCDEHIRAKIYCYVAACGLLWSNWCEYKRNLGVEFGEYSLRQYRYGKEFYRYAMELIDTFGED